MHMIIWSPRENSEFGPQGQRGKAGRPPKATCKANQSSQLLRLLCLTLPL
jgi:hypothetical protein